MFKPTSIKHKGEYLERVDIKDYVRIFLIRLSEQAKRPIRIRSFTDAQKVCELLNVPDNTRYKSVVDMATELPYWHAQDVAIIPSNLGVGAIFYFRCMACRERVRFLYHYFAWEKPLCRRCIGIPYQQASYAERKRRTASKAHEANIKGVGVGYIIH